MVLYRVAVRMNIRQLASEVFERLLLEFDIAGGVRRGAS